MHRLRAREKARAEREAAAQKLQAMFHTWKSRKFIRDLIGLVFVKRKHAYSSAYYYHNTRTRKMQWQKPVNMGSYDLPVPVWNVRCADGSASAFEPGTWYYENERVLGSQAPTSLQVYCHAPRASSSLVTREECAMPYYSTAMRLRTRRLGVRVSHVHAATRRSRALRRVQDQNRHKSLQALQVRRVCSLHFKMVHAAAKRKNHTSYDV